MISNNKVIIVYQFIINFKMANDGNSPSMRDIAWGCNISSTSLVHYYLQQLIDEGMIRMTEGSQTPRIVVVGGVWRLYGENISI